MTEEGFSELTMVFGCKRFELTAMKPFTYRMRPNQGKRNEVKQFIELMMASNDE